MDKPTFPDIDGLLGSIRHVATPVGQQTVSDEPDETTTGSKENMPDNENPEDPAGMWDAFMANLSAYGFRERKDERKVCMIDKDLADSIDECDIDRKCRSDVINAIVRTFITVYLPRLRAYRKKSKSLLDNDNTK